MNCFINPSSSPEDTALKKTLAAFLSVAVLLAGAAAAEAKITLKVANSGPDTLENRTVCAADVYTDMVKKVKRCTILVECPILLSLTTLKNHTSTRASLHVPSILVQS